MSNPLSSILNGLNPSQSGSSDAQGTTSASGSATSATTPTTSPTSTSATTPTTSSTTTSSSLTTSSSTTSALTPSTSATSSSTSTTPTTTSSTTSSSSTSATSTPTSQSSLTPQTSLQVTTESNGGTETITVVNSAAQSQSSASSSSSASASNGSSKSFFENKGAVAGTFTVVGLIGAALLIFVLTWAVRRRKARRADRESEEAAAEAATASVPAFLDDYEDRPRYGGGSYAGYGNDGAYDGGGGYSMAVPSASSHGTFAQPPLSAESYQMSDMIGAPYAGDSAYPAFISPRGQQQYGYNDNNYPGPVSSPPGTRPLSGAYSIGDQEMLDGVGPGVVSGTGNAMTEYSSGPVPVSRANTTYTAHTTPSDSQTDLSRAKSQGSRSLLDGYYSSTTPSSPTNTTHNFISPTSGESYAAHYQPGFPGIPSTQSAAANKRRSSAYDLPNPFARSAEDDDGDGSEEEEPRRVLKVANE